VRVCVCVCVFVLFCTSNFPGFESSSSLLSESSCQALALREGGITSLQRSFTCNNTHKFANHIATHNCFAQDKHTLILQLAKCMHMYKCTHTHTHTHTHDTVPILELVRD